MAEPKDELVVVARDGSKLVCSSKRQYAKIERLLKTGNQEGCSCFVSHMIGGTHVVLHRFFLGPASGKLYGYISIVGPRGGTQEVYNQIAFIDERGERQIM